VKVYRLDVLEVGDTPSMVSSSFRASRTPQRQEFYQSREAAEKRQAEIRNSITTLLGYTPRYEVTVTPVEVIEDACLEQKKEE
jgi:hypothetical protein